MSLVDALIACLLALPVALVVHELGHWLVALAVTGSPEPLGGAGASHEPRVGRVVVRWGTKSGAWGARVEAALEGKARTVAFLAAGPVASVAFGAALIAVGGVFAVAGAVSLLLALTTTFGSDGAGVLRVLVGNDESRSAR